ncbi:MAG: sigma factor-like helix-turn-helix DNA-binding protein [Planctomycetota bacterium]|jgi:hypothetical protein
MARSRYPRPGHRLAPAALGELLFVPVPRQYLDERHDPDLLLCDLDETAWEQFSEEVCGELALEVIRAVGRAIRTSTPIKGHRLPAIPDGMTLADLELEIRTLNCLVSSGIHERPQDLHQMTIGGVLELSGFWVKSLVDLLSSLEYVTDHKEARRTLRTDAIVAIKHLQAAHRYPRPNHRLAPLTLKEILLDRIPSRLVRGTRFRRSRLCDLDETAWEHLTPEGIGRLAGLIVSRAPAAARNPIILQRRLPRPPAGMRLEDLRLENRTHNSLQRVGYGRRPEGLAELTVGELLSIKAFGSKCLVDLLTSLETRISGEGRLDRRLTAEAKALGKMPEAGVIHFTDPRLGGQLRAMDTESSTVAELAERIVKRRLDPSDPLRLCEQIGELRDKIRLLNKLPLEEELIQIFVPASRARDRQIVAEYYGWDGRRGRTLEELGRKHGLSRERIRQVCARAIKHSRGTAVFAPVLDRALALLVKRLPRALDDLQAEFDAAGLSARRIPVESVRQAGEFLSRSREFVIVDVAQSRLAVHPKQAETLRTILETTRHIVGNYGVARITDLMAELTARTSQKIDPAFVRETLRTQRGCRWLDKSRSWFRLDTQPQYGLSNTIDKVLAVVGRIEIAGLRAAVGRYRRSGRKPPPPKILLEFCRQMPDTRVRRGVVISGRGRDWRKILTGVERCMVEVLKEHGPVMERAAFEELCIRKGMNRFSFNAILMSSPVVAQYGRSVYGLPGLKIDRKTVRELAGRKPETAPKRVLKAFGRTTDGKFYLAYRLSQAAISGGVVTVPAAMKRHLRGKFTLRTDQGHDVGTVVAKRGCGWGLGPALRQGNAQQGDHMLLMFDAPKRQARIHIGDDRLLNRVTDV